MGLTLFVDESGRFEPGHGYWPWGMRLVGGPALPGDAEHAEDTCRGLLLSALAEAGIPWWRGEVSGKHFKHPPTLAERLLTMSDAPSDIHDLARGLLAGGETAHRRLKDRGRLWLAEVRRRLGPRLAEAGGRILLVAESGSPGQGAIPSSAPFRRMLGALLGHSAMWASTDWSADSIDWVVADRGGLDAKSLPLEPWRRAIAHSRPEAASRLGEPHVRKASEHAGLQIADLVVHALGPGAGQDLRVPDELRVNRTQGRVQSELRDRFGAPVWVAEHDALQVAQDVRSLLASRTEGDRQRAVRSLRAHQPKRPPDGVYRAAVE